MLPSKGYFAEIPCVFFLGGGCRRPCCHYRHSQKDVKNGREAQRVIDEVSAKTNSWSDDQVNLISKLVEKAVDRVFREEPTKHLKIDKTEVVRATLNKLLLDNQAVIWVQKGLKETGLPLYEPTPIAELNNRHIPVVCVPEKPTAISSKSFKTLAPDIANCPIISETSCNVGLKTPLNDAYSGTQLDLSDNLSVGAAEIGGSSKRFVQGTECNYMDSGEYPISVRTPHFQPNNFELQDSVHTTEPIQIHPSAPLMAFYTVASKSDESFTSLHSSSEGFLMQTHVQPNELECKTGEHNSETNEFLPTNDDESCSQAIEEKMVVHTTTKQSKYNYLKPKEFDGKLTESCQKSLKRCLSLKHHKTKSKLHLKEPKPLEKNEKSASLKRCNQDQTREPLGKKLKASIGNEVNNDSSSSSEILEASNTNNLTTGAQVPNSNKGEGIHLEKSRIDDDCFKKPTRKNNLHVTSPEDPFSRWMKNKKLREILGKKSLMLRANMSKGETKRIKQNHTLEIKPEPLPAPKFTSRIAHKKNEVGPFPVVLDSIKIPLAHRQHFCDVFFQEFRKSLDVEEAKSAAQKKELDVARNSGIKSYKNNGSLQLMKLRKNGCRAEPEVAQDVKLEPSSCPDFTYGWSLYKCFSKYVMNEDEVRENGYPLPIPGKPNCAFIEKSARKYCMEQPSKPSVRVCANCCKEFRLGKDRVPITKDDCFYHWGRLRKVRSMGQWMDKFTCCDGFSDSVPCESSTYHVWSGRNEDCMEDFVETPKLPSYIEECDAGIYALDCEMCYTTKGLELARLTVVDLNEDVVFDQVVSLDSPVLDYCTRFSGINETKIRQATYTFDDVRAWVQCNIFDKTILLGHSLENDLKALKLIHKTVIDTSVTFPHKFGPPNKMSLKHLASSLLKINIQEDEGGHDSKEDATTCIKLMMMKIKEDSKVRKPRIIIGYSGKKR